MIGCTKKRYPYIKKMFLYHGTRTDNPMTILKEGLKPININKIITKVKRDYGLETEIDYLIEEYIRAKKRCLWVYLDSDIKTAKFYARCGSNFENLLRIEACSFLNLPLESRYSKIGKTSCVFIIRNKYKKIGEVKVKKVKPEEIIGFWNV